MAGSSERGHVVVAGAGPVGVVAALAAAQRGYRVTVLERDADIENAVAPRAATFHPSTLELVDGLGLMDDFLAVGLLCRYFDFWDKPGRSLVARLDHDTLRDDTPFPFVVQVEQHKLVRLGLARLRGLPNVTVRLGTGVDAISQSDTSVQVVAGPEIISADWLFGCDGGRSTVRKSLGIEFEGYTWPERFAVLTTRYDFGAAMGCSERSYFADPDQWANLFKVAGDDMLGRWRVVFAARTDQTDADVLDDAYAEKVMSEIHPTDEPRPLLHRNVYAVHQRVAASFRAGRVFLAGDAAHVNNPIGGLGLNCGIHDAVELVETVAAGDPDLLDRYERRRRTVNIEFVQDQTVENKRRLEERDPAARKARLDRLARIADDPAAQREFLRRTSLLESVARARSID